MPFPIQYTPEIRSALTENRPVVALESTIIAHGMPYPENLETAMALESCVRKAGAIPATIGILGGVVFIGMEEAHLFAFAKNGPSIPKVSRRDIPWALTYKENGATTVSATMVLAHHAGIPIFATGGIGGVHRSVTSSWDISTDLEELARTPVTVVSAGAKAILDLPKTLEFLETKGVLTVGYRTNCFPAFYTRDSDCPLHHRAESPEELAQLMAMHQKLNFQSGILVANPVPKHQSADPELISQALQRALAELEKKSIRGKEVTPYLLRRISQLTDGKSLISNIELAKNNANLAGRIAVAYQRLEP